MSILKYIIAVFLVLHGYSLFAQATGVGVLNPAYNLDVSGSFRLQNQNTNTTAGIWMDGSISVPQRFFVGTFNTDHFGFYGQGGAGWNFLINNNNHNVGIGNILPEFRLDINGRTRIRHSDDGTAGIWFDGTSLPTRSFIGNINDDYIGIWGSGGAGWNFAMNVTNGNTGFATTTPTAKLDLNGTLRIRSNAPVKGSVLTASDVNGNAEWVNPMVFRAESTLNNAPQVFQNATWTKVFFNQSPVFNYSAAYQPNTSVFVAPTDGIYEFNASVAFNSYANVTQSIRFIVRRNGVNTTIAQAYNKGIYRNSTQGFFAETLKLSADCTLLAGDQVWVEIWVTDINGGSDEIYPGNSNTWFSGQLVAKQ